MKEVWDREEETVVRGGRKRQGGRRCGDRQRNRQGAGREVGRVQAER